MGNNKPNRFIGSLYILLTIIGLAAGGALTYIVSRYLDVKYALITAAVCLLVFVLLILVFKKNKLIAFVLNLLLVVAIVVVDVIAVNLIDTTGEITIFEEEYTVQIVTRKDSGITADSDFRNLKLGYMEDEEYYTNWAFTLLDDAGKNFDIQKTQYDNYSDLYKAMLAGSVDIMIMSGIAESEIKEQIESDVLAKGEYRVLYSDIQKVQLEPKEKVNIDKGGFVVLVNGVDLSGDNIKKNSRSDANILFVVNPFTGHILVQVIPRDLYVALPCKNNIKTKLTRASDQGGTQCTIDALEQYFEGKIKINYFVKVNFTGFQALVDAVGGITINNPTAFEYHDIEHDKYYSFKKGTIQLDGEHALAFSRARKMLKENDLSRGKNQLLVIQGIINAFLKSPSLEKMNKILKAMKGNFMTSFSEQDFGKMFNILMNIKDKMSLETASMTGNENYYAYDKIYKERLAYFIPKEGQKEVVIERVQNVLNGQ